MGAILDAAEKQFAEHGRDGTTIRMVSDEADVGTALVHYYFEDLEGVYRAVIRRKADKINPLRVQLLEEYVAQHGDAITVAGVFEVFLRPVFEMIASDRKYWAHYAAVIAQLIASPVSSARYMSEAYDDTVHRFIELLMRLAPDVPRKEIYWFYNHLSGAQVMTLAQTTRIDVLSRGYARSTDLLSAMESMIVIFSAGFEGLRARHAKPGMAKKRTLKAGA